jgi:hypothetical protein
MRKCGLLGGAAMIVALTLGASGARAADATKCGDYKRVDNLTADGLSCGDAKSVVRVWIRDCGYEGRCVLEVNALDEQYACKGRKRGSTARITCTGRESGDKVRFTARV